VGRFNNLSILKKGENMKLIEVTNNTAQTVATGQPLVLGNISRRVGCFTDYSAPGTILTVRESGYYDVMLKVNAEGTAAAQVVQVTIYVDGVAIPETLASHVATAVGDSETLNTNKIIRIFACSDATISVINTGVADTVYDALVLDILKVV
jgi:hypothetical protein